VPGVLSPPPDDSLTQRIARYSDAVLASDVSLAERHLEESFTIVFLYPAYRVVDRAHWLGLLPDFRVERWDVQHEHLSTHVSTAAHYRLAYMQSTASGVERSGLFSVADYWVLRPGRGWLLQQRFSTPLAAPALDL
jgi:hypothetical protein